MRLICKYYNNMSNNILQSPSLLLPFDYQWAHLTRHLDIKICSIHHLAHNFILEVINIIKRWRFKNNQNLKEIVINLRLKGSINQQQVTALYHKSII